MPPPASGFDFAFEEEVKESVLSAQDVKESNFAFEANGFDFEEVPELSVS
jgi:hypothetical protein